MSNAIKLVIAVPCSTPYLYKRWVFQFLNQYYKLRAEFVEYGTENDNLTTMFHDHPNIATNRNELVRNALNKKYGDATHILFLDSDIIMPDNAIETMLKRNLPVHGMLCFTRNINDPKPIIYNNGKIVEPIPEGIIEVDSTGCGCLMVQREVFVKIADLPDFHQNNGNFFIFREAWNGNENKKLSEDRYFCGLIKRAGFKILVDTINSCEHLTVCGSGVKSYIHAKKPQQQMLPLVVQNNKPN